MIRYRERRKLAGTQDEGKKKKVKTRASSEKNRYIWRQKKREQRQNQSSQKKRRINEKRRAQYALMKKAKRPLADDSTTTTSDPSTTTSTRISSFSDAAKRKAVNRCLRVFPKNPEKFAEVLSRIVEKSSRRKEKGMLATTTIKEKLKELCNRRKEKDNHLRRIIHASLAAKGRISKAVQKEFGLSKKLSKLSTKELENTKRKTRSDALPDNEVKEIQEFYQSSVMSRELPLKRLVSAKKPTEPKKALEASLVHSYKSFKEKHPENKISYSKFVSLRPSNILPMTKQKHYQCLCEYCVNIDFKVKALGRLCSSKRLESPAVDRYEASRITLCPKGDGNYKKECLDRNCQFCGVELFDEKTRGLITYTDSPITWKRWEMVTQPITQKKFMTLVCKNGTVGELLAELKGCLVPFAKHLFNAKWQSEQFEELKKNMPEKWVMFCMDFGENYSCHHQDEAQGAHWHHEQVTLHPVVAYYRCPSEGCDKTVHESLVFISDDHKHDYHAVQHFVVKSNQYLLETVGLEIQKEIHFSDGAPTQYKSKANFVDLSMSQEDFGFQIEKHFFGSRHGKGPCDGEVGVVKRSASLAVRRGHMISNAKDFLEYAKKIYPYQKGQMTIQKHTYIPNGCFSM